MELISDIFFDLIVKGLIRIPGASVRWLFLHKAKSFKILLAEDSSYAVGMLLVGIIGITLHNYN